MTRLALTLIAASLALCGCNTVRGVGQDIESAADAGDRVL